MATDSGPQIPPWPPNVDSSLSTSKCELHHSFIKQLALKRNATASYQDLVDHHAYQGAHNSVKRFVQKITFRELERFDRLVLAPGEEAKVDYGEGALPRISGSNIYRRHGLFTMTCAHYGVITDPARVRDPNRKGTVESAIGYAQETTLKGRRFETLEEQQVFLLDWELLGTLGI